jgi:hypothetical protein
MVEGGRILQSGDETGNSRIKDDNWPDHNMAIRGSVHSGLHAYVGQDFVWRGGVGLRCVEVVVVAVVLIRERSRQGRVGGDGGNPTQVASDAGDAWAGVYWLDWKRGMCGKVDAEEEEAEEDE